MSADGEQRIAAAFAAAGKRAALMPYLMGGFPDLETSRAIGEATAAAGADMLELGIPFSDPLADADGQILEAHSVSAGLDYPGSGPEHAFLRDSGRARYDAATDDHALDAFLELARLEGIIPALESSHALAWVLANPGGDLDLVCLSGRGDKDLAEVLALRPVQ